MYMDDRKAQEQDRQDLRAQMESLSLELAAIGNETSGNRETGNTHAYSDTNRHKERDNGDSASNFQKFSKLDFPKYDGLTDPLGWLSRCEHFFRHNTTTEIAKVSMASYHLEGMHNYGS